MNPDPTSLDRLHDIVAPPAAHWWPPAPAWYWLLTFVLVLVLGLVLESLRRWQRNRYRREALAELFQQEVALYNPVRRAVALEGLAELLKRTALTAFPRDEVATRTGPAWFEFLDRSGHTANFTQGVGPMLERATYDPRVVQTLNDQQLRDLVSAVRDWIKEHDPDFEQTVTKVTKNNGGDSSSFPLQPSVQKFPLNESC